MFKIDMTMWQGSIVRDNIKIPLAISQSKEFEPDEVLHHGQMIEEAKLLVFGDSVAKAFFQRVANTASGRSRGLNFKITGKYY